MVLGDMDSYMQKSETRPPTYTVHKNKVKMVKRLKYSCDTIKVLEEKIGRKISDIPCSNIFTDMSPRARDIKERINKWDFIKIKSFCIAEKKNQQNEKGTNHMGKYICQRYLGKGFDLPNI